MKLQEEAKRRKQRLIDIDRDEPVVTSTKLLNLPPVPPPRPIKIASSSSEENDEDAEDDDEGGFPIVLRAGGQKYPVNCRLNDTLDSIIKRVCPEHANLNAKFDGRKLNKTAPYTDHRFEEEDLVDLS